jgi:ABC-type glycerol-3-phosphate transport system substrate-binding protein
MFNIFGINNSIFCEHWEAGFRKGGKKMKKLIVLLFIGLLLAGCSSEFYKHDTTFKDWDHVKFSWWGYDNPTVEDAKMSDERGWWGEEIPYIPAQ